MKIEDFNRFFGVNKPLIGMIHLAGLDKKEKILRAREELDIYIRNGMNGALIEDYHCKDLGVMEEFLHEIKIVNRPKEFRVGVNVLQNPFKAFDLAKKYGADFVQLDYVAGSYYDFGRIDEKFYEEVRKKHQSIFVFGGVWPKYYFPIGGTKKWGEYDEKIHGSVLRRDLEQAVGRADGIVVTGEETGKETPIDKIIKFDEVIGGRRPLIIGSGFSPYNDYQQMAVSDGVIVGSSLKENGNTSNKVDVNKVRVLVKVISDVRKQFD